MSRDVENYQRLRSQALFLTELVELLLAGLSTESRAANAVGEAAKLVRTAIGGAEAAANAYADLIDRINTANALAARMKAEGRTPTQLEWETLRTEIEEASRMIAGPSVR